MKKFLSLFLIICIITSICAFMPISVSAATSGTCGANLTWTLNDEGVLTISGTGDMYDWENKVSVPWWEYRRDITSIIIEPGVTHIGSYAFINDAYIPRTDGLKSDKLTSITIPNTVISIGNYAFYLCYSLENISLPDSINQTQNIEFYNCISLKNVRTSKNAACTFYDCISLKNVEIPLKVVK